MTIDTGDAPSGTHSARRTLLADRLRGRAAPAAGIARRPDGEAPPLSFAQERMWFMEQFAPGTTAYSTPIVVRLRGPLRTDALAAALDAVVARHEPLRTRFPATADGRPYVAVDPAGHVALAVLDAAGEDDARRLAADLAAVPFDLAVGPPLRATLIRLDPADHVLVLVAHHIAVDGYSVDVLLGDLFAAYAGEPRPEPAVRYGDFAAWQRERAGSDGGARDLAHWRAHLAGVPVLELPTDRPRPAEQTYRGAAHEVALGADLSARLRAFAESRDATLFMAMLAGYQALLFRYTGQRDFAVGTPHAGRGEPELDALVGLFVNTLAMRADLAGDVSFAGLVARTRECALDALTHRDVPVEHLIAALDLTRDTSRPALFQVFFAMQNFGGGGAPVDTGLTVEAFGTPLRTARFDLELYATDGADGLAALFVYNRDLFDAATVARLGGHFRTLLAAAVDAPDRPVADLDMLDAAERDRVLREWNDTDADGPDTTLAELIDAQVARTPHAVAVTFEGTSVTYAELDRRAAHLAAVLRARGAGAGTRVAVFAERSVALVVGLVAVLRAGAAYVPLDPDYPPERLAFMLDDAGASIVLAPRHLAATVPPSAADVVYLDAATPPAVDSPAAGRPGGPADPAYVIYTSGSTGRPKGVVNSHRGIVNRLRWMQHAYPLTPGETVLQKTPASFDVSVWEFFWPLITGARLVLARPGGHRDAAYLCDLIVAERVTTVHFVPSMLAVFLAEEGAGRCPSLRRVICSGEELPARVAADFRATLDAELHNLYGPTEAAVDVSAWRCTDADTHTVPIGRPVHNTRLYVLDERLGPQPVGVPGELYIAGTQVALGYLGRPGLTASRFVPDPYGPPGARMYATGDRAAWRADGALLYLGRNDDQVKIRGVRVELGEIAHALRGLDGVREAVAAVREDRPGDQRLVAYLVGDPPDAEAMRGVLRRTLPDALVPTAYVTLDALPLSVNGKVDRRALPAPDAADLGVGAYVAPATPTEHAVAAIWREVLGVADIGADTDFFAAGGHSLLATQVVARMRRLATPVGVSVMALFKNPTIRTLSAYADGTGAPAGGTLLHRLTPGARTPTRSIVAIPYGGGSAVVYQPLADRLPATDALWAVAIPGHDVGLDEDRLTFDALGARLAGEVLTTVPGPLVLYGHCGVGSALVVDLARRLEAAGRHVEAVYIGAMFPFARPPGRALGLLSRIARREGLLGNRVYANWLKSLGVDMDVLDRAQADRIITNMRADSRDAEAYFTALIEADAPRLRAPVVCVVGDRDLAVEFFAERYREWHFVADRVALVVLEEAGHFFLKYRAGDLAGIVTSVDRALGAGTTDALNRDARGPDADWWLQDSSTRADAATAGPAPSMRRFLTIAVAQLVSLTGSALTDFAVPVWILLQTGSLARFATLTVAALVPGLLLAPFAGVVVDRTDRRRVMIAGDLAAGLTQAAMLAVYLAGHLNTGWIYAFVAALSVAMTFQRTAYASATPQLVPKRYLGHANGIAQAAGGIAQVVTPLVAVGLLALVGLGGILTLDVLSYAVAVAVTVAVRFPATLAFTRREPALVELRNGWRMCWGQPGLRAMMVFFAVLNVFLGPLFLLISPLVLATGTVGDVGRISLMTGLGVVAGGIAMGAWGGPRRRRMAGMLTVAAALAVCAGLLGLSPALPAVGAAAFGMAFFLTVMNGIFFTIIQVKVPQRYHGRVLAINFTVNWSTLPLAFGVVAPGAAAVFGPMLLPGGALAGTAGHLVGVGPGRGIAFVYVLFAAIMLGLVGVSRATRALGRFDRDVPDALPDDLVGEQVRAARRRASTASRGGDRVR